MTYVALGNEITVNTTLARSQLNGTLVRLADGTVYAIWADVQIGSSANQFTRAQHYDAAGNPIGGELTLYSGPANDFTAAGLASGGFVLVSITGSLQFQLYDANGIATSARVTINPVGGNSPNNPDVVALSGGGFAVVWEDSRTTGGDLSGTGIHLRTYDALGNPLLGDTLVNTATTGNQGDASITALAGGGYVITWTDRGSGWTVVGQFFDSTGTKIGGAVTLAPGFAVESDTVALANGNFAMAWYEGSLLHVKIFTSAGVQVGTEFTTPALLTGTTTGPEIAALSDGSLAIVFKANVAPLSDGSDTGIFVQVIDANGQAVGSPMQANTQTAGAQFAPQIVALANGDFMVSWTDYGPTGAGGDDDQVRAQIFGQPSVVTITSLGGGETGATDIDENGNTVATVSASSSQAGASLVYTIVGGADAALFAIDPATGALSFVAAPDFEAPADQGSDNSYEVVVQASDGRGSDTQTISVTVGNINEAPAISSPSGFNVVENTLVAGIVAASDPDGNALTYTISGGADAALFTIDAVTGALAFVAAPDFEAPSDANSDNIYDVEVTASDSSLSDTQAISVTVTNANEAPTITSAANQNAVENTLVAGTVIAGDPEGDALTYAIVGGADAGLFTIDTATGVLSFNTAPDYETPGDADDDNVYEITVSASDGSLGSVQAVSVTVTNANEAPVITSQALFSVSENALAVGTVAANDPDGTAVSYAITGGADANRFTIDAVTGALAFVGAPNFEAPSDAGGNNVYDLVVTASDGPLSDSQSITVTVGNLNEAPAITSGGGGASAAVTVNENTAAVTTVAAGDPDGTGVTYSIVGGVDAARFTINASTGALSFVAAPNWEAPTDAGANNIYDVVVQASDGSLVDTQAIAVTVANVIDGVTLTGTSKANTLTGTVAEDTINGLGGNDTLNGGAGADTINGGDGADQIIGGAGADRLTGGAGVDTFVYQSLADSSAAIRDFITDFVAQDKISLSAIDANANLSGDQAFSWIGTAAFSNVAGQLRSYQSGGNTFVTGDVNGDGVGDFQIEIDPLLTLASSNFVL